MGNPGPGFVLVLSERLKAMPKRKRSHPGRKATHKAAELDPPEHNSQVQAGGDRLDHYKGWVERLVRSRLADQGVEVSLEQLRTTGQQLLSIDTDLQRLPWYQKLSGEQPIKAQLLLAHAERARRFIEVGLLRQPPDGEEMKRLSQEMLELGSWQYGRRRPMPEDEIQRLLAALVRAESKAGTPVGKIASDARQVENIARNKLRGRPVARRPLAVRALEMKTANPKLSWTGLAMKLCPCGRKHDFSCREAIRQEVMALKKVLRRYGIPCK